MKVVVGLGNPGNKYEGTRHNIGFDVLDRLNTLHGCPNPKVSSEGKYCTIEVGQTKLLMAWPLGFMNNSGRFVQWLVQFYKIDIQQDLLVVCDDLSLPLGRIRIRPQGSAGGQKGLADILQRLGDQRIARMRIGIDAPPPNWDAADYVLGRFRPQERDVVDRAIEESCHAIIAWCNDGLQLCMNKFNKQL